jgi:hypothetical protein
MSTGPFSSASLLQRITPEDWSLLAAAHPNTLVIGPDAAVPALLDAMKPWLRAPVRECDASEPLALPERTGTVILRDVDRLSAEQQSAVLSWLDGTYAQVISTSRTHLYPRVEGGAFLVRLYYRLNVFTLDLSD